MVRGWVRVEVGGFGGIDFDLLLRFGFNFCDHVLVVLGFNIDWKWFLGDQNETFDWRYPIEWREEDLDIKNTLDMVL